MDRRVKAVSYIEGFTLIMQVVVGAFRILTLLKLSCLKRDISHLRALTTVAMFQLCMAKYDILTKYLFKSSKPGYVYCYNYVLPEHWNVFSSRFRGHY